MYYVNPLVMLTEEFAKMPGIGKRTAQRLAFYIVGLSDDKAKNFAKIIIDAKEKLKYCDICQNITDQPTCSICSSAKRNSEIICVTETPKEVMQMEKTNEYNGLYHVLHGAISPMNNVGPDDIKIKELMQRVNTQNVKEIIMATNPNLEGETTAIYISKLLQPFGAKVTRIAHGVPVGSDLEYADEITLARALSGRVEMQF